MNSNKFKKIVVTLTIDPEIKKTARRLATNDGRSLSGYISNLIVLDEKKKNNLLKIK